MAQRTISKETTAPPLDVERALEHLVRTRSDAWLRLAARIVGSVTEAEDVVQEAWSQAMRAVRQQAFRQEAQLETWVTRVVLNAAFNARRSRRRREVREASWDVTPADAARRVEASAALKELAALLDALPEEQATALLLKEMHGMTAREVAAVMDCSEGAVEQRLVRARATLRKELGDE